MGHRLTRNDVLLPVEKPEGRLQLQQRLERQQVARVEHMILPTEEDGFGLELVNGWRFVLFGHHDRGETSGRKYAYRIVYRAIPAQKIWTKSMTAHFRDQRRPDHKRYAELAGGPLQKRIEGEMIVGVTPVYEAIQPDGGERIVIEFVGGAKWILTAARPDPTASRHGCPATIDFEWIDPPRKLIMLPSEITGPPRPFLVD